MDTSQHGTSEYIVRIICCIYLCAIVPSLWTGIWYITYASHYNCHTECRCLHREINHLFVCLLTTCAHCMQILICDA